MFSIVDDNIDEGLEEFLSRLELVTVDVMVQLNPDETTIQIIDDDGMFWKCECCFQMHRLVITEKHSNVVVMFKPSMAFSFSYTQLCVCNFLTLLLAL